MARYLDKQDIIEQSKKTNREIKVRFLVDWFNQAGEWDEGEPIDDYFVVHEDIVDTVDLNRDVEGVLGTSVRDTGTVVLRDVDSDFRRYYENSAYYENDFNYVEPFKMAVVQVKYVGLDYSGDTVNDGWLTYYAGYIGNITSNRGDGEVTIELSDPMSILQDINVEEIEQDDDGVFHVAYDEENQWADGKKIRNIIAGITEEGEELVKRYWMNEIDDLDIDEDSIAKLDNDVIYNFFGMSVYDALQMISELVFGYFYTNEFKLKMDSKMFIADENRDTVHTFSDKELVESPDDIFDFNEEVPSTDLYNEVEITSTPYLPQIASEVVWIGGEDTAEVAEIYYGNDFNGNELQLTHNPVGLEDYETEQPTRNVPIIQNSTSINFADQFYTERDGQLSVDLEQGIITINDNLANVRLPTSDEQVETVYRFAFNKILPGQKRKFWANLEHPCVKIEPLKDLRTDGSGNYITDDNGTPINDGTLKAVTTTKVQPDVDTDAIDETQENVIEGDTGYWENGGTLSDSGTLDAGALPLNPQRVVLEYSADIRSHKEGWLFTYSRDWTQRVEVFIENTETNTYESFGYIIDESGDGISGWNTGRLEIEFDETDMQKYSGGGIELSWFCSVNGNGSKNGWRFPSQTFSIDHVRYESEIVSSWDEAEARDFTQYMSVLQDFKDDLQTVEVEIVNRTNEHNLGDGSGYEIKLMSEIYGQEEEFVHILGSPIKQNRELKTVKVNQDSIDYYNKRNRMSISNDLFRSETRMAKVADFLVHHYSTPRSIIEIQTKGYAHLELLDKVELEEQYRDLMTTFVIVNISDNFQDGDWVQNITLEEFDDSWEYDGDFNSPTNFPSKEDTANIIAPEPVVDVDAYVQEVMTSNDGTYNARLYIEWDNPDNAYHRSVEVFIRRDGGQWQQLGITADNKFERNLVVADTYDLALISINKNGSRLSFQDAYQEENLNIIQKDLPTKVEWNEINWGADHIEVTWFPHEDKDFDEYELRKDDNFGSE